MSLRDNRNRLDGVSMNASTAPLWSLASRLVAPDRKPMMSPPSDIVQASTSLFASVPRIEVSSTERGRRWS
ncbi:MAG: hypothetical protein IPG63_00195 [Xanthomonadales bacterium]|nr:hypothetical protein [Xanthomonadales bacterium]MBK7146586.1 hypothetical protein [Xanthomonadales bacterium]